MIAFIVFVVLVTILLMGDRYVAITEPLALLAGVAAIALGVISLYALLFSVGETVEHFTR